MPRLLKCSISLILVVSSALLALESVPATSAMAVPPPAPAAGTLTVIETSNPVAGGQSTSTTAAPMLLHVPRSEADKQATERDQSTSAADKSPSPAGGQQEEEGAREAKGNLPPHPHQSQQRPSHRQGIPGESMVNPLTDVPLTATPQGPGHQRPNPTTERYQKRSQEMPQPIPWGQQQQQQQQQWAGQPSEWPGQPSQWPGQSSQWPGQPSQWSGQQQPPQRWQQGQVPPGTRPKMMKKRAAEKDRLASEASVISSNMMMMPSMRNSVLCHYDVSSKNTLFCSDGRIYVTPRHRQQAAAAASSSSSASSTASSMTKRSVDDRLAGQGSSFVPMGHTRPEYGQTQQSTTLPDWQTASESRPQSKEGRQKRALGNENVGWFDEANDGTVNAQKYRGGQQDWGKQDWGKQDWGKQDWGRQGGGKQDWGKGKHDWGKSSQDWGNQGWSSKKPSEKQKWMKRQVGGAGPLPIPIPYNVGLYWDGVSVAPGPSGAGVLGGAGVGFTGGAAAAAVGGSGPLAGGAGPGPAAGVRPYSTTIPVPIDIDTLIYPDGEMVLLPPDF
ncbi:hypothetical protein BGZ94_008973 [Podila epigama]|nr:hypothetical protein BGZ94_008973 [Podila epigama]